MRQFRFRAWHKGYDRPNVKTPIKPQMLYDDRDGDCITWKAQGQPLIVMQDTGFHDKRNTPIYEGDILATSNDGSDVCDTWESEIMGPVEWDEHSAGFIGLPDRSEESIYDSRYVTVIGNIYETPELLTK